MIRDCAGTGGCVAWRGGAAAAPLACVFAFCFRAARQPVRCGRSPRAGTSPTSCPSRIRLHASGTRVFRPRGDAIASLGTSVWIAVLTVVRAPRRRGARPAMRWRGCGCRGARVSCSLSCCRRRSRTCRSTSTSRGSSTRSASTARSRRRARARVARPGARRLDRLGGFRGGRRVARGMAARNIGASPWTCFARSRCRSPHPASSRARSSCSSNRSTSSPAPISSACPT